MIFNLFSVQSDEYKPVIEKGNATFAKFRNISKQFDYEFMTDGTNKSEVDQIWTNLDEFNLMNFDIDASIDVRYKFDHIPPVPAYIRVLQFGIVDAYVLVVHHKLIKGEFDIALGYCLIYFMVHKILLCILPLMQTGMIKMKNCVIVSSDYPLTNISSRLYMLNAFILLNWK